MPAEFVCNALRFRQSYQLSYIHVVGCSCIQLYSYLSYSYNGKMRDFRFPFPSCYFEIRASCSRSYIIECAKGGRTFQPARPAVQVLCSVRPLAYIRHISLNASTSLRLSAHPLSSLTWSMLLTKSRGLPRLAQEAPSNTPYPLRP